ncbi:MAG: NUDIX hydrolase [Alphaproteobacteria bacterium]|nr:NUDIX hydrolase [Alphaproteobacteria bacterium]
MKKIIYLISALISFPLSAVTLSTPAGKPVERAGMILIKDYNGTPCVLVGKSKHITSAKVVNFPAGVCDAGDTYTSRTAAREAKEETGGLLTYKSSKIRNMPYVYANKHQLFVKKTKASVTALTQAVRAAQLNPSLGHAYKEIDQYYAIPVQNLLNAAKAVNGSRVNGRINQAAIVRNGLNKIKSRNGHDLVFESHYLSTIAKDYKNAKNIFESLTGKKFS